MVTLTLNIHLPLLRIDQPTIPFLGGTLWQMPFETFNSLTSGAFEDEKSAYEQTMPVFFNCEISAGDTPWMIKTSERSNLVMEVKVPTNEQDFNSEIQSKYPFSIFRYIQNELMDSVWETLILGIPTGQFIQPRHSITFINADDDVRYFRLSEDQLTDIANFRGDADIEYLSMPEASGRQLDSTTLMAAASCYKNLETIHKNSDLSEALTALKTSNLPYISEQEKFTICMSAIENLVIPEVYKDIRQTFSQRIAAILGKSIEDQLRIYELTQVLYKSRSQTIHGEGTMLLPISTSIEAQVLLAQLVNVLAEKTGNGQKLAHLLGELTKISIPTVNEKISVQPSEVINSPSSKLLKKKLMMTASYIPGTRTASANENVLLYWSPLIGMASNLDFTIPGFPAFFTSLSTSDLISLEDKDIRRDFISEFQLVDTLTGTLGLSHQSENNDYVSIEAGSPLISEFETTRNMLVTGLRLAGFKKFIDPELLGIFMYRGQARYRQASVLRQSVFMTLGKYPFETLSEEQRETVLKSWTQLATYQSKAASPQINQFLNLYRIIHESRYMPLLSRAGLGFRLLENMLGPFRPKSEAVQLEDLVATIVGKNETSERFRKRGRETRNSIAHGYWDAKKDVSDFTNLVDILDKLIPPLLDVYTNRPPHLEQQPKDIFVNHILSLTTK